MTPFEPNTHPCFQYLKLLVALTACMSQYRALWHLTQPCQEEGINAESAVLNLSTIKNETVQHSLN